MTKTIARRAVQAAIIASAAIAMISLAHRQTRASTRPRYGGMVVIAASDPVVVMDPSHAASAAERAFSRLVFEPLFERTEDGLRPALVMAWEANGDSTVWTLRLDGDVRFHDGRRLTARDATYSLMRVVRSSDPLPCRWPLRNLRTVEIDGAASAGGGRGGDAGDAGDAGDESGDDRTHEGQVERGRKAPGADDPGMSDEVPAPPQTIVLYFDAPEPRAPLMLSCPGLAVIQAPLSSGFNDGLFYEEAPCGTGPFGPRGGVSQDVAVVGSAGPAAEERAGRPVYRSRKQGPEGTPPESELVAFQGHRSGRPFLDAVSWRFAAFEDAVIELQAGALDVAVGFPSPSSAGLGYHSTIASRQVVESSHMLYLACNPSGALRQPSARRRALAAVDRSSMMRSIVGPGGRIAQSLLAGKSAGPGLWQEKERVSYGLGGEGAETPEAHRLQGSALASGASGASGARATSLTLIAPRWHETAGEVADRIQVDLMAAGFAVTLRKLGVSEMAYKLESGDFDLLLGLWAPDRWLDDEDWLLSHFWETQIAAVPSLASALRPAGDGSGARAGAVPSALEEKLAEGHLLLPLFHLDTVVLIRNGFVAAPGPGGFPDLSWSWIKTGPD